MLYETQSQWNLDELKKLNKAALFGMHKAYVALVIGIEVMMVVGIILSAKEEMHLSNTMRYTGSLKQTRTSIFSWQKIRRST